jgi:hypothetical protein
MKTAAWLAVLMLMAMAPNTTAAAETQFPLRDGDLWVFAGDSITHADRHVRYIEAYCFARYPQWRFAFRNAGIPGDTVAKVLPRFEHEVAAWRPTVVSVELGANQSESDPAKFVEQMEGLIGRIRAIKARPVIFSPHVWNNGETSTTLLQQKHLSGYATALKTYTAREGIPYADQFHPLIDVWGTMKPRSLLGKDQVHPDATGHLMMAAVILKALGADSFVSSAELDASGTVVQARGCQVREVAVADGGLQFSRLDERLPFPIPDDAREILPHCPEVFELSQYMLKVTGLKDGDYALKINGIMTATRTARELATGINLTGLGHRDQGQPVDSPIVTQGRAILEAAGKKNLHEVNAWRELSRRAYAPGAAPELRQQLETLAKKTEEADEKIRRAARPAELRFELIPAETHRD